MSSLRTRVGRLEGKIGGDRRADFDEHGHCGDGPEHWGPPETVRFVLVDRDAPSLPCPICGEVPYRFSMDLGEVSAAGLNDD